MMDWLPIDTAPKNGRQVWVRRIYEGRLIAEGWAVWGIADHNAPMRAPLGPDPLNRLTGADYAREAKEAVEYADTPRWLKPGRKFVFPTPTHWTPNPPSAKP